MDDRVFVQNQILLGHLARGQQPAPNLLGQRHQALVDAPHVGAGTFRISYGKTPHRFTLLVVTTQCRALAIGTLGEEGIRVC